jgi:hypothetical protein
VPLGLRDSRVGSCYELEIYHLGRSSIKLDSQDVSGLGRMELERLKSEEFIPLFFAESRLRGSKADL